MSYITKALKKIQDLRQNKQDHQPGKIVYLTDTPEVWPKTALRILLVASVVIAILINITVMIITMRNMDSKQTEVAALERTIKIQEKRINDFISAVNKNQEFTDRQINDLNVRLKQENEDSANQINNLTLTSKDSYLKLKEAIIDNKQQIDSLNNDIRSLDQKIEAVPPPSAQAKDVTSPASGN